MYDESKVQGILRRATEIDAAKSASMTRHEIMQVAAELEISREAVEQALREVDAAPPPTVMPAPRSGLSALRVLNLSAGAGVVYGLLMTSAAVSQMTDVGVAVGGLWTGLLMASGGLAVAARTTSLRHFIFRNASLWLGVGFGWSIAVELALKFGSLSTFGSGTFLQMGLVRAATAFTVTTIGGVAFVALRRLSRPNGSAASGGSGTGTVARVWARAKRRLQEWLLERLVIRVRLPRVLARST